MPRRLLSIVAGIAFGILLLFAVESVGQLLFPLPEGVDPKDAEEMRRLIAEMPLGAFLWVAFAWAVGSFGGGWLAARLTDNRPRQCALSVAGFLMAAGAANLLMLPHPTWFWFLGLAVFLPAGWAGLRLSGNTDLDG